MTTLLVPMEKEVRDGAQHLVAPDKTAQALPVLFAPEARAAERFMGFFTVHIRNPNTRRAYYRIAGAFSQWCAVRGIHHLAGVRPMDIAAYIEGLPLSL